MRRFVVFDRKHEPLFDLDERIVSAVRTERLKGEHKLDVETTQPLEEGMRILVRDGTLKWREWVVDEPDEHHTEEGMVGTYGCTWSMQYDLASKDGGELWPGTYSPITAGAALAMVLATQDVWEVGEVSMDPQNLNGTTLYDGQVWDYLGTLQEVWGGEMEPRIVVDGNGVTHRYVDWHAHVGQTEATRRFDFGEDCTSIHRKVAPGPRFCRVVPRGGRDAQDADGIRYSDRCGVEEEPYREDGDFVHDANSKYVRDTVAEQLFRTKDRHGNWHYPEKVVCYDLDLAGDQEELLNKAMAEVAEHTRPKTTYEADVLQFAAAGLDPHGVQLGDEVQIVDRAFGDAPLRLQARVVEMTVNELDDTDVQLVIGEPLASLDSAFKSLSKSIADADGRAREIQAGGTIAYVEGLLDAINAKIAADGGYTYMVNGQGTITYDTAVTDPLVGTEATQVVQMKGGTLRFANEKKPGFQGINDWKWQTVITPEGFLGLAATIAHITAGYIGNAGAGSYWNLDTNELRIATGAQIGSTTAGTLVSDTATAKANASQALSDASDARKVATNYLTFNSSNGLDIGYSGTNAKTRINGSGMEVFDGNGVSALYAGLSGTNSIVRVGRQSGSGNVVMSSEGYVDVRNASTIMAHFGYGDGNNSSGGTSKAPYYDLGIRKPNSTVGNYSLINGYSCEASGYYSHAEGYNTTASGSYTHAEGSGAKASGAYAHAEGSGAKASGMYSHAEGYSTTASTSYAHAEGNSTTASGSGSHAEGNSTTASGTGSHAEGDSTTARGLYSHAEGFNCTANGEYSHAGGYNCNAGDQAIAHGSGCNASGDCSAAFGFQTIAYAHELAFGEYNVGYSNTLLEAGCGAYQNRADAMYLTNVGNLWIKGTLTQNSDRRLKEHHAYLGDDACDFIRALKPALYTKDGARHVGFYAQDVQAAEPEEWDTETVTAQHTDESLDFDPLTLDYNALIAPLVAYTQQLERRIDEQQEQIDKLTRRLDALEGGA